MKLWRRLLPPGLRGTDPLGEGVWRRAHDRFSRSVDRFAAVDDALGGALAGCRTALDEHRDDVLALCVRAQQQAPSSGLDLPGGAGGRWLDVHRDISRAATAVAQACEAATMYRVAAAGGQGAGDLPDDAAVRRAVTAVGTALARAQARASA